MLLSRCDPSASVVRFIEEATVDLTCCAVSHSKAGVRLSAPSICRLVLATLPQSAGRAIA